MRGVRVALALALACAPLACALVLDIEDIVYDARPSSADGAADRSPTLEDRAAPADQASPGLDAASPRDAAPDGCDRDIGFVTSVPPPGKDGDWNCDGVVTRQHRTGVIGCNGTAADCAAASGFVLAPECGESDDFIVCATIGSICTPIKREERTQGCR